jgi:hypothetical protein
MGTVRSREILGQYADQGFNVEEPDDEILVLNHEGSLVGRFIQSRTTKETLQDECAKHLAQHPKD